MEEHGEITQGEKVNADDYLKVNKVTSGGIAIARHVEVNKINSGGLVICESVSKLEKLTSGGILICRNLHSSKFTPQRDYHAFTTLGAYLSHLKQKAKEEATEESKKTIQENIKQVKQLMTEVDLEV